MKTCVVAGAVMTLVLLGCGKGDASASQELPSEESLSRQKKESAEIHASVSKVSDGAKARNRAAIDAFCQAQTELSKADYEVKKAEEALNSAKNALAKDTKKLEEVTADAAKRKKVPRYVKKNLEFLSERVKTVDPKSIADAEAHLSEMRAKKQRLVAEVAEAKANVVKTGREGADAVSEAEQEGMRRIRQSLGR